MSEVITTSDGLQFIVVDGQAIPVAAEAETPKKSTGRKSSAKKSPKKSSARKSSAPKKAPKGTITAEAAWQACGGDETYQPGNLSGLASGRFLYRLNKEGRLSLNS